MLELVKYIVNQFAEHKDEVEYQVYEEGPGVTIGGLFEESEWG